MHSGNRSVPVRLAALSLALLLPACYVVQPLATPMPAPGTRIVGELSDRGMADMDPLLGPGATEVEGLVALADSSTWQLRVLRVDRRDLSSETWKGERVAFARSTFEDVHVRRLSKSRSYFMAGGILAAALVAARLFNVAGIADSGGGGTAPPQ